MGASTTKCVVTAPTRIDLAGGTLDIWPLAAILQEKYDLWNRPIKTINVAIDLFARAEVVLTPSKSFEWCFKDIDAAVTEQGTDLAQNCAARFPLHRAVARFFMEPLVTLGLGNIQISSTAMAPRGSGLGGSSSLVVAMLMAVDSLLQRNASKINMCRQARHLEAGVLGNLAGNQDHFAAAFGGVQAVTHGPEGSESEPITCNGKQLLDHLVLAHSGQQHFSAFNNWQVLEKALTGNNETLGRCAAIARLAHDLAAVLPKNDWKEMARIMTEEWELRRGLDKGITTPMLDGMFDAARRAGAVGGKVCGAGGGGVLVTVLNDPADRDKVASAIAASGGVVLNASFSPHGARVSFG